MTAGSEGVPPGEQAQRVGCVVGEQLNPGVAPVADRSTGDEVTQTADRRHGPVVEPDRSLDGVPRDGLGHLPGILWGQADGLLDPKVLACFGDGDADVAVQRVRRCHGHDVDLGVSQQVAPVIVRFCEPVLASCRSQGARHCVRDSGELRAHPAIQVVLAQPRPSPRVNVAEPAGPDDSHTDPALFVRHSVLLCSAGESNPRHEDTLVCCTAACARILAAASTAERTSPLGGYSSERPTTRPRQVGSDNERPQECRSAAGSGPGTPPRMTHGRVVAASTTAGSSQASSFSQVYAEVTPSPEDTVTARASDAVSFCNTRRPSASRAYGSGSTNAISLRRARSLTAPAHACKVGTVLGSS